MSVRLRPAQQELIDRIRKERVHDCAGGGGAGEGQDRRCRSGTVGDRFLLVDPGLRFPLAGAPDDPAARLVRPEADAEVENYLVSSG